MLLNVKKGPYPSLQQMDKELLLSASETGTVERGICLYQDTSDEWRIAGATQAGTTTVPGALVYFALQGEDDLTAQMAGGVPVSSTVQPKIAAISCTPTIEIETDMFTGTLTSGQDLAVGANGKLVAHSGAAAGATIIARVTRVAYTRWVNNAAAVAGWRTGNNVTAIRAITMYAPQVA
jgi:hypothetical protein